ncbi:hypothetical protein RhiirA4_238596 [Rhizophagus irregularis]|uniref:Uncharacterized protein n=1 Tax=Rhizophagus irregularis TaxID=588596 RepID=A0A2I1FTH9_9GLOM|nr:hypothetical protein RhiirA4_238596 [Rhizophagus irregularis]
MVATAGTVRDTLQTTHLVLKQHTVLNPYDKLNPTIIKCVQQVPEKYILVGYIINLVFGLAAIVMDLKE